MTLKISVFNCLQIFYFEKKIFITDANILDESNKKFVKGHLYKSIYKH